MKLHSTSDFRKNYFDTFVGRANIVLNCVKVNGTKQLNTGTDFTVLRCYSMPQNRVDILIFKGVVL